MSVGLVNNKHTLHILILNPQQYQRLHVHVKILDMFDTYTIKQTSRDGRGEKFMNKSPPNFNNHTYPCFTPHEVGIVLSRVVE